jgi:hypothetical protein
LAEAIQSAERLGWPIVVKTAEDIAHKSDQGGVVVGVEDASALEVVYSDLSSRLGPRVLVQEEVPAGIELALGTVLDPQFGPLVMVAAGGVLVEILEDRAFAFPPLDKAGADRLLSGLAINRLLGGVRGAEAADCDSILETIVRLSILALDLGDRLAALDINPVIASSKGCTAVDALVVPREQPVANDSGPDTE